MAGRGTTVETMRYGDTILLADCVNGGFVSNDGITAFPFVEQQRGFQKASPASYPALIDACFVVEPKLSHTASKRADAFLKEHGIVGATICNWTDFIQDPADSLFEPLHQHELRVQEEQVCFVCSQYLFRCRFFVSSMSRMRLSDVVLLIPHLCPSEYLTVACMHA